MSAFGRYEILERVGAGGMAEVYLARAFGTDGFVKDLVLKKILDTHSGNMSFRKMFIDEAKITVGLTHTNIVQVFDFGKVDHTYFLAMERVNGIDLRALIGASNKASLRIPVPVALYVVSEMLKGLDYAHRRTDDKGNPLGIVHRDVSPSNVLLSYEGEVKVADFGIARVAGGNAWATPGQVIGKPRYMSPEQLRDEEVDGRADVFACGAVLHELLCGKPAFAATVDDETVQRVINGDVKPPSALAKDLPRDLDGLVMKALAPERKNRHSSAAAFLDAIQEYALDHRMKLSAAALSEFMRKCIAMPVTATMSVERQTREVTILKKVTEGDDLVQFTSDQAASGAPVDRVAATEVEAPAPPRRTRRTAALMVALGAGGIVLAAGVRAVLGPATAPLHTATPTPLPSLAVASAAPSSAATAATVVATVTPGPTHVAVVRATPRHLAVPTPEPTAAAVVPAAPGTLNFNTIPPGQVSIDGRDTGRFTPLIDFELAPGPHDIVVIDPSTKARAKVHVEIVSGKRTSAPGARLQ